MPRHDLLGHQGIRLPKRLWKCRKSGCWDTIGEIRPDGRVILNGRHVAYGTVSVMCHCGQVNQYVPARQDGQAIGDGSPEPEPPSAVGVVRKETKGW